MALRLLLADHDEEWLLAAKKYFQEALYEVDAVTNGKDAQLSVYNNKYFAVIMSLQLQNHSGTQVLKFIRTKNASQKIILMSKELPPEIDPKSFEEKYRKLGACDVLLKPLEFADIKMALEGQQNINQMMSNIPKREGVSAEEEVSSADDKFSSVKITEFYSSKAMLYDIFIKLKSEKYIKILHAGDTFSKERLDKYKKERGVEYLYFNKNDLGKFLKFHNHVAKKAISNKLVPSHTKIKMLQNVAEKLLEQVFSEGLRPQIIDQAKDICESVYTLVESDGNLWNLLKDYQDFDRNAFSHAYLVTMFSSCIIKQFDWQSKNTIEATAMACMFHDIGQMRLSEEIRSTRVEDMTEEQYEEYKMHPEYGAEMLENNRLVHNSVKQIIRQHHEHYDGSGFPTGVRGSKILTLANIVCLSSEFADIISDQNLKPVDALKVLLRNPEKTKRYNSMIVENLIKVFTDPTKITTGNKMPSNSKVVANKRAS